MNQIRVAGIVKESVVDGPGLRFVVFAQGCKHNCPGCHNPKTHSFDGGQVMKISEIIEQIDNPLLRGVTFSGGEPFEQAEGFAELAAEIKNLKIGPHQLDIVTYTGYTYKEIFLRSREDRAWKDLLMATDILIDGPFMHEYRDPSLKYRGSYNQLIIDVKETLKQRRMVTL